MGHTPEYMRNYRRSEAGKAAMAKYRKSAKGKARTERYLKSDKGKTTTQKTSQAKKEKCKEIIRKAKDVPCADCGAKFDQICMDFHHQGDSKIFNIGESAGRRTPNVISEEIAKCIVICANCHRLRHKHSR